MSALFDSGSGKTVTVYRAVASNNNYGTAFVGTVSGTSISFGTSVVYESSDSTYNTLAYDSTTGKVVIGFRANTYGNAIVGTVSGTSISFGVKNVWRSADTSEISLAYDIPKSKIVLSYRDSSNGYYISSIDGTVSGTSISFGPAFDISGSKGDKTFSVYDPDSAKVVVGYGNQDNSYIGTAVVVTTPSSNNTSFIGITSEAISNGATGVVNIFGGISSGVSLPLVPIAGAESVFNLKTSQYNVATYDSNSNKVVIGYRDDGNSNYGTAVVGTVSGTSISFGTAVVFESANITYLSATFDSNSNKVVFAYTDVGNSSYGTSIVGTVSGTSISFGTAVVFESAISIYVSAAFDSTNNKVVVAYTDQGNSSYGTAIVGTVSGSSISYGSPVVFTANNSRYYSAVFDSNAGKIVIPYQNQANSYGQAIVGTVSGTSISFGTAATFEAAGSLYVNAAFDSTANKVIINYRDQGNSNYGTAIVGTVSGTSISFGTAVVYNSGECEPQSTAYDSNANKTDIFYVDSANSYKGTVIVGTISGTSISFGSELVFNSAQTAYIGSTFDSTNNKVVAAYRDDGNSAYGTAVVINLSGDLAIASDYYVQSDGTLSTASSSPAIKVGQAISTTTINMKDLT